MNYGKILYYDTANGIGCRTTLFVSGCRHHCKECFNYQTWDFNYGIPYTNDTKEKILQSLDYPYIDGLSILGGEPFEPENQKEILDLVQTVKTKFPTKSIWIYSGYLWEELIGYTTPRKPLSCCTPYTKDILRYTDVLIDGEYQKEKRNIMLEFRGSENQRIIDVPATLRSSVQITPKLKSEYMKTTYKHSDK